MTGLFLCPDTPPLMESRTHFAWLSENPGSLSNEELIPKEQNLRHAKETDIQTHIIHKPDVFLCTHRKNDYCAAYRTYTGPQNTAYRNPVPSPGIAHRAPVALPDSQLDKPAFRTTGLSDTNQTRPAHFPFNERRLTLPTPPNARRNKSRAKPSRQPTRKTLASIAKQNNRQHGRSRSAP